MRLEDQVVSLEFAKKLKELGVKQESHFKYCGGHTMYHDNEDGEFEECDNTDLLGEDEYCHTVELVCEFTISAFTAAELGEILPDSIIAERGGFNDVCNLVCTKIEGSWWITYDSIAMGTFIELEKEKKEVDARAKMLIYLKENKLV